MLGLQHGANRLVDYDPAWAAAFDAEKVRIEAAITKVTLVVEHYGSTAVEGLRAKPILDILLGVSPFADWSKCRAPLEGLGYDYAADAGVPGHHIFGRGRTVHERTHLVHVVELGGDAWRSNLAFRDALRADRLLRADYLRVKELAATLAPQGRSKYNELKQAFFEELKNRREPKRS